MGGNCSSSNREAHMRSIWPRRQFRNDKLEEEKKERRGERKENGSWEGERARLTDTSGRTRLRWEVWEGGGKGGGSNTPKLSMKFECIRKAA